jgi:hypothetical protein
MQDSAIVTIWKDDVFGPGSGTLESLMRVLEQFDFAAMILSPDDTSEIRGQTYASPRDNVLFELGLFMGRLGPKRVFVVHEADVNLKLPSDLAGIGVLTYRKREDRNLAAAVSPPSTLIMRQMNALGYSERRRCVAIAPAITSAMPTTTGNVSGVRDPTSSDMIRPAAALTSATPISRTCSGLKSFAQP